MKTPVKVIDPTNDNSIGDPFLQSDSDQIETGEPAILEPFATMDLNTLSDIINNMHFDSQPLPLPDFPFGEPPALSVDVPMDELTPFIPAAQSGRLPPTPDAPIKAPRPSAAAMKAPCKRVLFKPKPTRVHPKQKRKPHTIRLRGHKGAIIHSLPGKKLKKNDVDGGFFIDIDASEVLDKLVKAGGTDIASCIPITMTHLDYGRTKLGYAVADQGIYTVRPPKNIPIKFGDGRTDAATYNPVEQCYEIPEPESEEEKPVNAPEPEPDFIDLSQETDDEEDI